MSAELSEIRTLIRDAERRRGNSATADHGLSGSATDADGGKGEGFGSAESPRELTISEQMRLMEAALPHFATHDHDISERLDHLNRTVSSAFSEYSGVLRQAAASFEDAEAARHGTAGHDLDAVWRSRRREGFAGDVEVGA